ncbi:MAG: hypothetical protein GY754_26925 [bacterium]|nr:hypothetical protein [bacterium]
MNKIILIIVTGFLLTMLFFNAGFSKILKNNEFKLILNNKKYSLSILTNSKSKILNIPQKWLLWENKKDPIYENIFVSPTAFSEKITSFEIGENLIGLQLSSYNIQEDGSAQSAAGKDVFLIYNTVSKKIYNGNLNLGITKARYRSDGCFSAINHQFIIADMNNDKHMDIGVIKEELLCREFNDGDDNMIIDGPFYQQYPIHWYLYKNNRWVYAKTFDARFPIKRKYWELPILGIVKSPIDFLKEWNRGNKEN